MKKQSINPEVPANLRQKAEKQLKLRKSETNKTVTEADMLKLIHELEVHQIELELQNEELILANNEARAATEKYAELYDFAPSGYITLSKEGDILELNFAAANMLGKERTELIKKRLGVFVSIDTRKTFNQFLLDVFTGNEKQTCEAIIAPEGNPALAGQALPIYVNIDGIVSQNDELCLLTLNDITESIRAKNELQRSEEKYRISEFDLKKAQQIAHLGNWALNIETNELLWSDEIYKIFDCEPQEFEATYDAFLGFIHPDDREKVNSAYLNSLETKTEYQIEHRIITKNNQIKYVREKCLTTFNEQGKPLNSFGIVIDITESKQAEEALHERTELLQNIVNHMFDMVAITNLAGVFTYAGPSHRILGFEPEQLLGTSVFEYLHPEDANYIADEFRKFIANPTPDTIKIVEYRQLCLDGSYLWLETMGKILFSNDGTPSALFFSSRNITERKQAEKALLAKVDELERFFKLTVGREITMVELKKEINNLLKKLGEAPKYKIVE